MRYSINSRFRGSLVGATLGEKISQPGKIKPSSIAKVIVPGAQSLVELGSFDYQSWSKMLLPLKLTPLQAIIATLPLALFYHDNNIKLRQNLLAVAKIWENEPIIQEGILALGYAIAIILTEKLVANKLIAQIVAFIDTPSTDLSDTLIQVLGLLDQKAGIEKTISQINPDRDRISKSIALGFYYFLSTLEDFKLSINRSIQSPLSSTIVGALSGAYNSISNIPSNWQTTINLQATTQIEMLQLSDSLVAVWSGAYDSTIKLTSTAVAAPRVIRSR